MIENDKGIEVNTSGLRYRNKSTHPNLDILKQYKKLGGKIITLGSDAHKARELGLNFEEAIDMINCVGFDEIAIYHNRIPSFVKTKELSR